MLILFNRFLRILGIVAIMIFLLAPVLLVFPIAFSADSYVAWPPSAWSMRWYVELWANEEGRDDRRRGQYPNSRPELSEWISEQGRFSNWEVHDDIPQEFLGAAIIEFSSSDEVMVHWNAETLPHLFKIARIVGWDMVEAQEYFINAS